MGWLDRLKGTEKRSKAEPETTPTPVADDPVREDDDPAYEASYQARATFLVSLGDVDDDVLAHIISPEFLGAPPWPTTRQAFRVVRRSDSLIVATDGLSDPFHRSPEAQVQGFELEVFVEVPGAQDMAQDEIMSSNAFKLVRSMANVAAWSGQIAAVVEQRGLLSSELELPGELPDGWHLDRETPDNVGVLIGMKSDLPTDIPNMPFGFAKFIPVTAIRADETDVAAADQPSKEAVAAALIAAGHGHRTVFDRVSVI